MGDPVHFHGDRSLRASDFRGMQLFLPSERGQDFGVLAFGGHRLRLPRGGLADLLWIACRRSGRMIWPPGGKRACPPYDRLNKPTIELQITLTISARPEIGFAAAGAGGGTREGDARTGAAEAGAAGAAAGPSCASFSFRHLANWFINCAAVAWMMPTPRPYWATAPDSVRLVCTSTLEPLPAGSRRNVATELAPPRPLASVPCAAMRAE